MAIVMRQASSIQSVACDVVEPYLEGFEGVLLADGIQATKASAKNTRKSPTPSAGHIAGVALSN